jgi:hypothetical protein
MVRFTLPSRSTQSVYAIRSILKTTKVDLLRVMVDAVRPIGERGAVRWTVKM